MLLNNQENSPVELELKEYVCLSVGPNLGAVSVIHRGFERAV